MALVRISRKSDGDFLANLLRKIAHQVVDPPHSQSAQFGSSAAALAKAALASLWLNA